MLTLFKQQCCLHAGQQPDFTGTTSIGKHSAQVRAVLLMAWMSSSVVKNTITQTVRAMHDICISQRASADPPDQGWTQVRHFTALVTSRFDQGWEWLVQWFWCLTLFPFIFLSCTYLKGWLESWLTAPKPEQGQVIYFQQEKHETLTWLYACKHSESPNLMEARDKQQECNKHVFRWTRDVVSSSKSENLCIFHPLFPSIYKINSWIQNAQITQ